IPFGCTMKYKEIAQKIVSPKSYRAVANACASNKLAVEIPCHRVIRQNGEIYGYRWGIERKEKLLQREQALHNQLDRLAISKS
ncbi:methylated-DNA--[protein]-cysteine S-methyltransferase, partial [Proteus mirabilis]|uniref:methylated-DNA--[protein]-cysteine S-methyltransferase n=1 Tax=Proteus mirabilis TaxID=584 RepID=UPI0025759C06